MDLTTVWKLLDDRQHAWKNTVFACMGMQWQIIFLWKHQFFTVSNSRKYPYLPHGRDLPHSCGNSFIHFFKFFGLTSSVSGEDEPNSVSLLAIAGFMVLSCPLGTTCWISQEKFPQESYHSRPQRPRSFWSVTGMATSGQVQLRKSAFHGLPITLRMLRAESEKCDWFWSRSIVFTKPFKTRIPVTDQKDLGLWGREWSHILILNPSLTKMAGYWSDFFVSLWTSTLSWSIDVQKNELGQYLAVLTSCLVSLSK